jgi:3-hydroxyacyl-CoA dehydrogenase
MSLLAHSLQDGVALIAIDDLGEALMAGLAARIAHDQVDPAIVGIVVIFPGIGGAAGDAANDARLKELPDLLQRIEASEKPVVTVWQGLARDEVFEFGLAAHARIIAADARVGLTFVKRGCVPGAGGTQRLPRLSGLPAAFDLLLSGRMMKADEALRCGLADIVSDKDVRVEAIALARRLSGTALRRAGALTVPDCDAAEIETITAPILRRLRGQDAPQNIVRLLRLTKSHDYAWALAEERATALRLQQGPQAAALRHVAWAERNLAQRVQDESKSARAIQPVGIVGAGTMGTGIAVAFLDAGYDVTLIEADEAALARGLQRIEAIYNRLVASGRMQDAMRQERLARLVPRADLSALNSVDLVLEAIFEDMDAKMALLAKLDAITKPSCILATNTSYLNIDRMAGDLSDPSRLVGMHFFSPAHIMKMLEVVRAERTAPDVVATALAVGRRLGKVTVVAGVCDGFIGNRIFSQYRALCEFMLEEGALPFEIDDALEAYGFAMGPFTISDLAGLDISWARRKSLAPTRRPDERYVPIADLICEMGRFGQKTGSGWYRYDKGKRMRDPEIEALVRAHATKTGYPQKAWTADEIVARILAVMANEGTHILDDGIATKASDIDLVLLNGYGFPAYRGGPMFAADQMGWGRVVQLMESIAAHGGPAFKVASRARALASGQSRIHAAV